MESKELSPIEELYNEYIKVKPLGLKLKIDIDYYLAKEQSRESTFKKQIEELQSQLAEKDKEIERLKFDINQFEIRGDFYKNNSEQLQSELTSLKEKHKKDVIKTYIHCKEQKYGNYDLRQITFDAEQYYTQTHEKE